MPHSPRLFQEIFQVYDALSKIPNGFFTVAAAFGNVHGVYQPGNVKLEPTILDKAGGEWISGWWFGCHFLCSHILGIIIIPSDFHIFQRGGPTTNQSGIDG